jgi:sec-independent protein translocase protein TatA
MSVFVTGPLALLGFAGLGMTEMAIIGAIAVLLFGKKLPDVAKQLGGSYREFRKGLTDFQSNMDTDMNMNNYSYNEASTASTDYDDYEETTAPRFEPPPAEPQDAAPADEVSSEKTSEKSD